MSQIANQLTAPNTGIQWIWQNVTLPNIIDPLDAAKANGTLTASQLQTAIGQLEDARNYVDAYLNQNFSTPIIPREVAAFREWLYKFTKQLIDDRNSDLVAMGETPVATTLASAAETSSVTGPLKPNTAGSTTTSSLGTRTMVIFGAIALGIIVLIYFILRGKK